MKKLGLALSSGGARGMAHVGVIKVLEKNNIPISYIAGTSIGAVIAAYYALYLEINTLEKVANNLRKRDLVKLIDLNDPRISLVKGKKVKKFLKRFFGNKKFKDTKIPLRVGATSLKDGSAVVFSKGKILDALMASGAFPGVFPPIKYKGKYLVDGGLTDGTPVQLVNNMGADVIVAVDLVTLDSQRRNYDSLFNVLSRTYEIVLSKLADYKEKEYGNNIVVLKPNLGTRMQTFAFNRAPKNIKIGEVDAQKQIRRIKKLMQ